MLETVLKQETHFQGKLLRLDVAEVLLPDNSKARRELVYHPDAVCAAVLTPEKNWVLVRQYRLPARSLLLECPAGKIDAGEEPDQAIERELREEIGYQSGKISPLIKFWASPGFCQERMSCYLVEDAVLGKNTLDAGEFLEIVQVPLGEGVAMALDGRICDAKSIATILAATRFLRL